MKLSEIVEGLNLEVKTCPDQLNVEITCGYAGDLLSDVIANAEENDIWLTMQTHQNIVAVSVMKSLGAIVLVNNRQPEDATIRKAEDEKIPILVSPMRTFQLAGKLTEMGVVGR